MEFRPLGEIVRAELVTAWLADYAEVDAQLAAVAAGELDFTLMR